jgi:hypothetical protein
LAADLESKPQEVADLQRELQERDNKLAEAQNAEAELIRKRRELEDAKHEMDLQIETRVQESLSDIRHKAKHETEDALKLKVLEKEEQIASMHRQIEDIELI